jgi:hypothetical protein
MSAQERRGSDRLVRATWAVSCTFARVDLEWDGRCWDRVDTYYGASGPKDTVESGCALGLDFMYDRTRLLWLYVFGDC